MGFTFTLTPAVVTPQTASVDGKPPHTDGIASTLSVNRLAHETGFYK